MNERKIRKAGADDSDRKRLTGLSGAKHKFR